MAPYLALCREDPEQRDYDLPAVFNGLRYIVRTGGQWRYMPNDLPPWPVQCWIRARYFETMAEDLRMLLHEFSGHHRKKTSVRRSSTRTL